MDEGQIDNAAVLSVGDLVRQRLSTTDRLNLALVQRAEVWDEVRMRHLLDSLLAGYPIGAILLCRVRDESRVITVLDGERLDREADPEAWQLLDGQQRINALFSMLTDKGDYGRFYLHMTMERAAPAPAQRRAAMDRSLPHIVHRGPEDEDLSSRESYLDLSRWAGWASAEQDIRPESVTTDNVADLLASVDPECRPVRLPAEAEIAAPRLRQLLELWTTPSIPVLRATLQTPLDVLEVFTRINLGGVQVGGMDVYFAGVKTFWRDAETRLDRLAQAVPVLRNRFAALRMVSRLASRGLGYGDPLPLVVDRLTGRQGESLMAAMEELTDDNAIALRRLSAFTQWYVEHSQLRYGLRQVTWQLWDEVLAWAAANHRSDEKWYGENLELIDSYLLGATLFSYRSVMGEKFARLALLEALDAGSRGEPFPLHQIVAVARGETNLRGSRGRAVLNLQDDDHRARLARRHGWLMVSLAQCIPHDVEESLDWDHIFPKAHAGRMWAQGQGRKRHHKDRHLINSIGNLWALSSDVNRELGKTVGRAKFDRLRVLAAAEEPRVWPTDRWSLTEAEIDAFVEVDALLVPGDPASTDRGMALFKETVNGRGLRLLNEALERFPLVQEFAMDAHSAEKDSGVSALRDYATPLGLTAHDPTLAGLPPSEAKRFLHRRARNLEAPLRDALVAHDDFRQSWVWPKRWRGHHACVAYEVADGTCAELVLRWNADDGMSFTVKAYPTDGRPGNLYADFDHVDLGVGWQASDEDIATEFLGHVERLHRVHPKAPVAP
ncbi:DUF262 domain-containing protein [Ornithinimicrobium cerasi]|nr:DUF262 domain-containing protein [Ornithinimicrobium cerasi]